MGSAPEARQADHHLVVTVRRVFPSGVHSRRQSPESGTRQRTTCESAEGDRRGHEVSRRYGHPARRERTEGYSKRQKAGSCQTGELRANWLAVAVLIFKRAVSMRKDVWRLRSTRRTLDPIALEPLGRS